MDAWNTLQDTDTSDEMISSALTAVSKVDLCCKYFQKYLVKHFFFADIYAHMAHFVPIRIIYYISEILEILGECYNL